MVNWKEVTERWLPIVEHMEEHSMDDYAIPEIYRAAENYISLLEGVVLINGHTPNCPQFTGPYDLGELEPACVCGYKGD